MTTSDDALAAVTLHQQVVDDSDVTGLRLAIMDKGEGWAVLRLYGIDADRGELGDGALFRDFWFKDGRFDGTGMGTEEHADA